MSRGFESHALRQALRDPHVVSVEFLWCLQHLNEPTAAGYAEALTTPESRAAWGDFTAAAALLESFDRWGLGSQQKRAVDAVDVAYAGLIEHVDEGFQMRSEDYLTARAVVTLVWRPEGASWLVHAFGPYVPPGELPRSSPDAAPEGSLLR